MEQRLIYRNSDGVRRTLVTDEDLGAVAVFTEVDVEQLIKTNRALEEEHVPFSANKIVARIPLTVFERAVIEGWVDDEDAWRKFLNDPDNRAFRVWQGRV